MRVPLSHRGREAARSCWVQTRRRRDWRPRAANFCHRVVHLFRQTPVEPVIGVAVFLVRGRGPAEDHGRPVLGGVWGQQEGTVERGCTHDKVGTWLGGAIVLVISLFPRVTTQGGKRARNILKTHLVGSRASTVSSLLPSGMTAEPLPAARVRSGRKGNATQGHTSPPRVLCVAQRRLLHCFLFQSSSRHDDFQDDVKSVSSRD